MSFYLDYYNPEKKYFLMDDSIIGSGKIYDTTKCRERYSRPIDYDKNWIDVTHFDVDNGILSGLFEFKLINVWDTTCLDTFHLTQGRFDLTVEYIE